MLVPAKKETQKVEMLMSVLRMCSKYHSDEILQLFYGVIDVKIEGETLDRNIILVQSVIDSTNKNLITLH